MQNNENHETHLIFQPIKVVVITMWLCTVCILDY